MAERTTSQVVGAALVGSMVGAGLALLFAPRSGKETREHIHQSLDDMKQGAGERLSRLKDAAHRTGKKAKADMEELRDTAARKGRKQSSVLSAWEEEV